MNNYDQSPYYASPQQGLALDPQSRGSSASSSMQTQLLSPLQDSTAIDWSTQLFFGYDGQSKDSISPSIPGSTNFKNDHSVYGTSGQQQNFQAVDIESPPTGE